MASRLQTLLSRISPVTPQERERRARGAQRLKERLSRVLFYAKAAEKDGDKYWEAFYASRVNS
jgi:hypothetical protein